MAAETFDRYEILRREDGSLWELGRGAMAVTYKAVDQNLRFPVALKVIDSRHLEDEHARARFVREARAAAALRHPNIAGVHHLGLEGETYFYAMEFVDGETLEQMVARRGPLPPLTALTIAAQAARALGAAARSGIVHRDIKPANVMVAYKPDETSGDTLVVKVIDFGLARPASRDADAMITLVGFVGTPQYASPEQIAEKELDIRSDIYSLGVTLWFMLTGRPPFVGSAARVSAQHLREEMPWRDLARLPAPVTSLLRTVLARDPARRPQDPVALRRVIEATLADPDVVTAKALARVGGSRPSRETGSGATEAKTSGAKRGTTAPSAPVPAPTGATPKVGDVINGRFTLVEAVARGGTSTVFRARDAQSADRTTAVRVFRADAGLTLATVHGWHDDVARLAAAPNSRLIAVAAVDQVCGHWWVAEEWVNGFPLVEILRSRGQLSLPDALHFLARICDAAAHARKNGLRSLDVLPDGVLLHFPAAFVPNRETAIRGILSEGLCNWPKHECKLRVISLRAESVELDPVASAAMTMAPGGRGKSSSTPSRPSVIAADGDYCAALALLLYELLSGAPPPAGLLEARDLPPVASLGEEANDLLGQVVAGVATFEDEREFYSAIVEASDLRGIAPKERLSPPWRDGQRTPASPPEKASHSDPAPPMAPKLPTKLLSTRSRPPTKIGNPTPAASPPKFWRVVLMASVLVAAATIALVVLLTLRGQGASLPPPAPAPSR